MEETAATDPTNTTTDLPSSLSSPWPGGGATMMVVVSVVVGMLGVAMVWWRCRGMRQCSRQLLMRKVVKVDAPALYHFLSDPANLKIIHPYTTEIRMKKEAAEEDGGGVTLKEFDWVEKVPFTVVSAARMRCDPRTFTITIDVVPIGSIHEVRLKWLLTPVKHPEPSDVNDPAGQAQSPQEPSLPNTVGTTTGTTTPAHSADDTKAVSSAGDAKAPRSTEFRNQIRVTGPGPCLLIVIIVLKIVQRIEVKLMDRLQQHFEDRTE